ncbi:hypothetical protein CSA37_02030 [Candidatus Fermentibacteria bacterium]|nr:MAG: hypothetical protein CSA37_02030 [Candidatus Fermentibacteria bacterium]
MSLNKMARFLIVGILVLHLFLSCGNDAREPSSSTASQSGIQDVTLEIRDTLKVPPGDFIANVADVCGHPELGILVLDNIALSVRYSSNNGSSATMCEGGSGPGELLYPLSIACFSDGRFLIADEMKNEVMIYSQQGEYVDTCLLTEWYVPYKMITYDSAIVCDLVELDYSADIPEYTYSVRKYVDGEFIPQHVYAELRWDWDSSDFYTDIEMFDFTASHNRDIYIAKDVSRYLIEVFSPSGEFRYLINRSDVPRLPKSDQVIQDETAEFERWARQDQAYMGGYQPSSCYPVIELAGVDSEGNLWVRRLDLASGNIVFDIYDSDGSLFGCAELPIGQYSEKLQIKIDQYGMYASTTDESDNAAVYSININGVF